MIESEGNSPLDNDTAPQTRETFDYAGTRTGRFSPDTVKRSPDDVKRMIEQLFGNLASESEGGPRIKLIRHDSLDDALKAMFGDPNKPCPDCDCGAADEMPEDEDENATGIQFGFTVTDGTMIKLGAAVAGVVALLALRKFIKSRN